MPYTRSTRSGKSRAEAPQPGIDADKSAEITENIKELLLPSDEDVSDRARKLLTELREFPENFDFNKLGDALIKNIHKKLQLNTKPKTPTLVKNLKFIVETLPSFNGKSVEALMEVKKELLGIYHLELVGYFPADMNNKEKSELAKDIVSLAARRDDEEYYLDVGCDEIMAEVNLVGHQYENGRRPGRSTLVTHLQQATENYRYQSDDWVKNRSRTVIELRAALFQLNPDRDQIRAIRTKGDLQEAIIKLRNEGKHVPPDPPSSIEVETNYRPHSAQNESAGPKDPPVKNVAPLAALEEEDDNRNGNIAATEGVCNRNDAPGRSAAVAGGVSADDGSRAVNNDAPTDNNNPTIVPPTPKVSFITPATNRQPSNQGPPELGQVAINPDDRNAEGDSSNQGHGQRAQVASTLDVAPNAEGDSPQVSDRDILRAINANTQAQLETNQLTERRLNGLEEGQNVHGQRIGSLEEGQNEHGQRISATEVAQATQTNAIAKTMGIAQVALLTAQKVLKGKKGLLGRNSDPLQRTGNLFDTPLTRSNDNDVVNGRGGLSGSNLFESLSPLATESGALAPAPDASADGVNGHQEMALNDLMGRFEADDVSLYFSEYKRSNISASEEVTDSTGTSLGHDAVDSDATQDDCEDKPRMREAQVWKKEVVGGEAVWTRHCFGSAKVGGANSKLLPSLFIDGKTLTFRNSSNQQIIFTLALCGDKYSESEGRFTICATECVSDEAGKLGVSQMETYLLTVNKHDRNNLKDALNMCTGS